MKKFWLVWNEQGHPPAVKHEGYLKACDEAERLAKNFRGMRFHVLEVIGTASSPLVMWEGKDPSSDPDYIPF